jgi:tRNA pseudouridine38-40 synthase
MNRLDMWYDAWTKKDKETIKDLLHENVFGCRFYNNHICYSKEEIFEELDKHKATEYKVSNVIEEGSTIQYELELTDHKGTHHIVAKAVFEEDTLLKLFETKKTDKTRVKVICSYDGSAFYGYQRQVKETTIQGTLESALQELFEQPIKTHASGRTDKGVHALHQVFHFDVKTNIPVEKMTMLLDTRTPDSIHILSCEEVPETFHSRYDVVAKEYMYKMNHKDYNPIQRNYEWYVPNINLEQLEKDAKDFLGTHDFQSFTKRVDKDTTRTIESIRFEADDTHTYIYIKGNGFLRYMVRYMAYALVQRNQGLMKYTIKDILDRADVHILGELAPPTGLYLYKVYY